jgi:thiamine biosynthesis lipoprotein
MTSQEVQTTPRPRGGRTLSVPLNRTFRAMASQVTLQVIEPGPDAPQAIEAAQQVFERVESACTRFDPASPLMRANAAGQQWHSVPEECYLAVAEAGRAHAETGGLFDPRVLDTMIALGYDRTLPFEHGPVTLTSVPDSPNRPVEPDRPTAAVTDPDAVPGQDLRPWRPGLDPVSRSIRLGARRVDLGGIGKGLAVRLASAVLAGVGRAHLVEAGGDCYLAGQGPHGDGWRVGVEDPAGAPEPVAVLRLSDLGCATSSVRVRSWQLNGRTVHHLIDPRTGRSAQGGVRAVTVLDPDPARAETWSKALLIAGLEQIAGLARDRDLAALWVDFGGEVGCSERMAPAVIWRAPDVR